MTNWKQYQGAQAHYAEVGAFIMEAHPNGSWVVRHVHGLIPCRSSELEPVLNPGANMASAKIKAAQALNEILQASGSALAQVERQQMITRRLCERYQAARKAQAQAAENAAQLVAELDAKVAEYLGQGVRQAVNNDQTLAA